MAGIGAALALGACGSGSPQDAQEPSGNFPVQVVNATWPGSQRLAQSTHLVIRVKNSGSKAIPNIAVTITDPHWGTAVQAFGRHVSMTGLASHSRPVWIIDHPPGPCSGPSGFSCVNGGPGGAATAYANTWALGRLQPGASTTFNWKLTAVAPGNYVVHYRIAAGLNGKAKAKTSGGAVPEGNFTVKVSSQPSKTYVNNNDQIVSQGSQSSGSKKK